MNLRLLFLLATCFMLSTVHDIQAQVERNAIYKIGIGHFNYTPKGETDNAGKVLKNITSSIIKGKNTTQLSDYADDVRASIAKGFGNVVRLQVIDGKTFQNEKLQDKNLLYTDGTIVSISATSNGPSLKERKRLKNSAFTPYTNVEANISVTVNVKNAYTGVMEDSRTFNASGSDTASEDKAVTAALSNLSGIIAGYFNARYPVNATIIERGEIKKEKQKTVYIDLGTSLSAYKGQQFDVYSVKEIAGKEARIEIGRLKVEEVLGEELSLCKVTKGEKDIKTALDNGSTLVVTVRR